MKFPKLWKMNIFRISAIIFLISCCLVSNAQTQEVESRLYDGLSWNTFIQEIEDDFGVRVYYVDADIPSNFKIKFNRVKFSLKELLESNLSEFGLVISFDANKNIFITKEVGIDGQLPENFFENLKEKEEVARVSTEEAQNFLKTTQEYVVEKVTVGRKRYVSKNARVTVKGYITNSQSGEPIIGATIYVPDTETGVATDVSGYYEIDLVIGKHIFEVKSVSTVDKKMAVDARFGATL